MQIVAAIPANEREETSRNALLLITPEMNIYQRCEMIWVALNQREERIGNALLPIPPGIDVHENNRDQRVKAAIELLFEHQKHIKPLEINKAKDSFITYLENSPIDETKKTLARGALLEPRRNNQDFGPLINDEGFTILGLQISGEDLIGRLWIFVSELTGSEKTNARVSMISALSDSYNGPEEKVCNQGKAQRLVVAVLQGRLPGVNIEGDIISNIPQAMGIFFSIEAHKKIHKLKDLMKAANQFCNDHCHVNKDAFILEMEEYAKQQRMED